MTKPDSSRHSRGFDSPEQAAIASFPGAAHARVVDVQRVDDASVHVIVDTDPSHPMRVFCERREHQWFAVGDVSA
jgi:hypothetical protein